MFYSLDPPVDAEQEEDENSEFNYESEETLDEPPPKKLRLVAK